MSSLCQKKHLTGLGELTKHTGGKKNTNKNVLGRKVKFTEKMKSKKTSPDLYMQYTASNTIHFASISTKQVLSHDQTESIPVIQRFFPRVCCSVA